ncbi:MAG: flotillin family protein, partial [Acidobacteriota bacterium]|nr:flotillin family protein [Acidobacteriota bacterium]
LSSRYRRCPSDRILVVYGKIGGSGSAKCYHGGAAFIVPILQAHQFLDLEPMTMDINLTGALSKQNIRVNCPSTFTVGISTEAGVMENAAERLLGMRMERVSALARDIIFGQMRVVLATMPIEEINADRDKLIENISNGAARAINEAKVKVAEQERDGEVGAAAAERDRRIQVAEARATAQEGENESAVRVAQSDSSRRKEEAEAERDASAAEKVKAAQALQEAYAAQQESEVARASREQATQRADVVVPAEIKKEEIATLAEAEAERNRRLKRGEADGIRSLTDADADRIQRLQEAEAAGIEAVLKKKAEGFDQIVEAIGGADNAALLLATEQLPKLVEEQVKAIAGLQIDNVTVWDSGRGENGKTATADFVSGLIASLPPLHELTKNVGIKLPEYLGSQQPDEGASGKAPEADPEPDSDQEP